MGEKRSTTSVRANRRSSQLREILSHPVRSLRWTGWLRGRPVSHLGFEPLVLPEPARFAAPEPRSVAAASPWISSVPADAAMGHTLVVPHGIANCLGYVFEERGRLIDGGTHKHREGREYRPWRKRVRGVHPHSLFPTMERFDGSVAVLTASTQRYYFHWLLEVLPRLGLLAGGPHAVDRIFVDQTRRFQRETLELLGIDAGRIIDAAAVAVLSADSLVVPCHQIMRGREYPAWAIRRVRDAFLPLSEKEPVSAARRIYVSRGASDHRRLRNEEEIAEGLRGYGFVLVRSEELSFLRQVRLFRGAEVVVAPHGSGLANVSFCSPGTTVIELFPAANVDLYYRLCAALRLDYRYVKDRTGDPSHFTRGDYEIAWEDLKRTLDDAEISSTEPR